MPQHVFSLCLVQEAVTLTTTLIFTSYQKLIPRPYPCHRNPHQFLPCHFLHNPHNTRKLQVSVVALHPYQTPTAIAQP
ncbi:hypothetical protein BGW80DRAFT_37433 [Lactifluus volemus]|nr:hypothetical protein BGW80DRAFT_37433 [Lactifluus volemus]